MGLSEVRVLDHVLDQSYIADIAPVTRQNIRSCHILPGTIGAILLSSTSLRALPLTLCGECRLFDF